MSIPVRKMNTQHLLAQRSICSHSLYNISIALWVKIEVFYKLIGYQENNQQLTTITKSLDKEPQFSVISLDFSKLRKIVMALQEDYTQN